MMGEVYRIKDEIANTRLFLKDFENALSKGV
jgi:hypothetical protein